MKGSITKIEQQKRNPNRFNIYINGEYAISVHEDVLVQGRLTKGRRLEENEWMDLLTQEEEAKARQRALAYIGYKPRTRAEVERYLKEKGFETEPITSAIAWLQSYGYIDDRKFAKAWVEERRRTKGKGIYAIRHELQAKGIDEGWIAEALATITDEDELQLARQWAHKRYERVTHLKWEQIERRIGSFLSRKGFSYACITEILRELRFLHDNHREPDSY